MAGKRRKVPKVTVRWESARGTQPDGRRYAILRWTWEGKRDSTTVGWATEEEAETAASRKAAALLLGVDLDSGSPRPWTVAGVIDEYLDDVDKRMGAGSRYGLNEAKRLMYVVHAIGSIALEHVTAKRLQHYAGQRARETTRTGELVKRRSITEEIAAYRRAHKAVLELGHEIPPVPDFPNLTALPDDGRPARRLTEGEVGRLLQAMGDDIIPGFGALGQALAWSGRRMVAVFALRRRDCVRVVDDRLERKDRLAYFEKDKGGRKRGWAPLTEPALVAIRERYETMADQDPDALLWATRTGLPFTDIRISRPFARAALRAGVAEVQPYDLRRFACTRILTLVRHPKVAIEFTGHKRVETLFRYVYAEEGQAEEAASRVTWTPAPLRLVKDDEGEGE